MASVHIRRRSTGKDEARYDVRYRRGGRYFPLEHAGTFRTLKDARARRDLVSGWLAENKDPAAMLAVASPVARTLQQVGDDWLRSRRSVSETSIGNYRTHLARAVKLLGNPDVREITVDQVRAYLDALADKVGPSTVRLHVATLRRVLDHADLAANPARHRTVELPRREPKDLEPPDADELLVILAQLARHYRPVLLVMEQCGLRITETLALEPDDVGVDTIRVRREVAKTGRPRIVPCPVWLAGALKPPFRMTRQRVWNALAKASDDAGVKRYGPHQWRHRRATLWHLAGVPPVEVSRRLGHARTSITLDTYTHARPVKEADAHRLASLLM